MSERLVFTIDLAQRAGELLLESFHQRDWQINEKADSSLVTGADLASDRLISQEIQRRFPGEPLVSEEQHSYLPLAGDGPVWVVDPLDGTTNFSLGLPIWGVAIARLEDGHPVEAVMYFPVLGELYTAQRGKGAWMNGNPLRVNDPDHALPQSFFSTCSRAFKGYQVSVPYKTRILGSATYSFCSLARGMALVTFEAEAKIWDIAAPWLLVCEAGGTIETLDESAPFPLQAGLEYATHSYPTLATASSGLLTRARRWIKPR